VEIATTPTTVIIVRESYEVADAVARLVAQ